MAPLSPVFYRKFCIKYFTVYRTERRVISVINWLVIKYLKVTEFNCRVIICWVIKCPYTVTGRVSTPGRLYSTPGFGVLWRQPRGPRGRGRVLLISAKWIENHRISVVNWLCTEWLSVFVTCKWVADLLCSAYETKIDHAITLSVLRTLFCFCSFCHVSESADCLVSGDSGVRVRSIYYEYNDCMNF